jgi:thiol-disulfide isomerase/thioredoxin
MAPATSVLRLTSTVRFSVLASLALFLLAAPVVADPPPSVERMLSLKPRQPGVDISTPTKEEFAQCEVKLESGGNNSSGWVLLDAKKQPVRRFYDTRGDRKGTDTLCYYKDGVEVYREIDSKYKGKPDQYRWLNSGGTKWGVDLNEDGVIDSWRVISSEEVAQEVYIAVSAHDFVRLKALFITDAELTALKLNSTQTARIRDNVSKAQAKFQELTTKATSLNAQSQFVRVESAVPQCLPADAKGPPQDLLRFPSRAILYQGTNKNHEWLHTGEMILVGQAWRLTGAPSISDDGVSDGSEAPRPTVSDEALKKMMDTLMALDKNAPASPATPGKYKDVADYNTKRVALLEQICSKVTDAKEKETWVRQILDNLCTGHQANEGDDTLLLRLRQYKNMLNQNSPGSNMAGYAYYRELWARYAFELYHPKDAAKTQREWTDELAKFVAAYPKAEDAADALGQLAMNAEFGPKEKQDEAKKYYSLIATNFPDNPMALKAKGAVKRLDLTGKTMELTGPTLQGAPFDLTKLKGKEVVVYYWASNVKACIGDFAMLKQLHTTYGAKGFEVVTVNLDETQAAASSFLAANSLPGTHLFQATEQAKGLDSPLAVQYGIVGLPTVILIGKDGRVIDRSIQVNELEDAVKKGL